MPLKETCPPNSVERRASAQHSYLAPPVGSTPKFEAEWNSIVRSFPPEFFRQCDAAMLAERVACALELRDVQELVRNLPSRYVPNAKGELVQHPALKDRETLRARLRVLCIQTRTSPGSRTEVNQVGKAPTPAPEPSDDPKLRRLRGVVA